MYCRLTFYSNVSNKYQVIVDLRSDITFNLHIVFLNVQHFGSSPQSLFLINCFVLVLQVDLTDPPAGAGEGVAHGATRPLSCDELLTVSQQFALDLFTDGHAVIADAYATRFWFPDVLMLVDLTIHVAALTFLLSGT